MIDWDLCIGAGLCLAESPAAFELVETAEGPRAILRAPDDDGRLEAAARRCPTMAIRLWDASGQQRYPPPAG